MIVQCATFSKSLNPRNTDKSVLNIRIRIRFRFESSFWISVSGCKLPILPDIQPENRIVIIFDMHQSDQNTDRQSATLPHPQQPELMTDQFIQENRATILT